jgi:RNase H-fold protein (predicted Holliday junction resolvase)
MASNVTDLSRSIALGVDPGTVRCGIASVAFDGTIRFTAVEKRKTLVDRLSGIVSQERVEFIAVGNGTGSRALIAEIQSAVKAIRIIEIDETDSTVEGVNLALRTCKPLLRPLLLAGFIFGLARRDGWAAAVIAKRALDSFPHML